MLWFPLFVNDRKIGVVTAIRREGDNNPDSINVYEYEVDRYNGNIHMVLARGTLDHRYGDGAFELMRKILSKVQDVKFE